MLSKLVRDAIETGSSYGLLAFKEYIENALLEFERNGVKEIPVVELRRVLSNAYKSELNFKDKKISRELIEELKDKMKP